MKNSITVLLLHLVVFGFAQDRQKELGYGIRGNYQQAISKEKLNAAKTLSDINAGYPSASWIRAYEVVELTATNGGETKTVQSSDAQLNKEQLAMVQAADLGTTIDVDAQYYLQNSLENKAPRTISFSYTIIPAIEAEHPDGEKRLRAYLKKTVIDKISDAAKEKLEEVAVHFVINKEGQITNTRLSTPSGNAEIDSLLLETVRKMPKWSPAENPKGTKVEQEFIFSIGGYMIGC